MATPNAELPRIAILGAGIFVRSQYIPRLRELADTLIVKSIWSRSEESAKVAVELVRDFAPEVECKWGDAGLDNIMQDDSISGVAVVLAGQVQVDISLKLLRAGKHVIQEKPAAGSIAEAESALSSYKSSFNHLPRQPIWAVAENYRFEPAFVESRKLVKDIGDMMNIQVIVEGSMNSKNPYFSSSWRRNFTMLEWVVPNECYKFYQTTTFVSELLLTYCRAGFILDMGVHFIAGLRMIIGCEIATISAVARHVDMTLPPPDNLCSLFQLENGCAGVFVMAVSSALPKVYWRVDGTKGTLQVERGTDNAQHGYVVQLNTVDGLSQRTFYPFAGVHEELKTFINDILEASKKEATAHHIPEPRSSYIEGARDIAVIEAMLESSERQGTQVPVKKF